MIKTTVKIEGMVCVMCEARLNETIWRLYPQAKKVRSSHVKGVASFLTEETPDADALRAAIDATGYRFVSCENAPYEKKGHFGRGK